MPANFSLFLLFFFGLLSIYPKAMKESFPGAHRITQKSLIPQQPKNVNRNLVVLPLGVYCLRWWCYSLVLQVFWCLGLTTYLAINLIFLTCWVQRFFILIKNTGNCHDLNRKVFMKSWYTIVLATSKTGQQQDTTAASKYQCNQWGKNFCKCAK